MDFKKTCTILAVALIPAQLIILCISSNYNTPLIGDDYRFLYDSTDPNFSLKSIGTALSRTPSFGLVLYYFLNLKFLTENLWLFYHILFACHVVATGLITFYLIRATRIDIDWNDNKNVLLAGLAIAVLSFYPNFLELTSWPSSSIYFIGGIFLGLALLTENLFLRALFFFVAFGFYETYVLPAFALVVLPYLVDLSNPRPFANFNTRKILIQLSIFILALGMYLLLRHKLASIYGQYNQVTELPSIRNFKRIISYLFRLGYHSSIIDTVIELLTITGLSALVLLKERKFALPLLVICLLIFFSTLHDLLVTYPALRVVYGAHLMRCAFIILLLILVKKTWAPGWIPYTALLLLLPVYLLSYIRTYQIRTKDYAVMERKYNVVKNLEKHLPQNQAVVIEQHTQGMDSTDWVVEGNSYIVLALFKLRAGIDKNLTYIFKGEESASNVFPRYYPCASMDHNSAVVLYDTSALSGEILHAENNVDSGSILVGPYIHLDTGKYIVSFHLKADKRRKENDLGRIEICSGMEEKILANKTLASDDFPDKREFKSFPLYLHLPQSADSVQFRCAQTNPRIDLDYIKIEKQ